MSIFDEIIDGLKKAAEIAVSGGIDGGGIIPMLAEEPQKKTELIGILAALHEVLGVAEHFSSGAAKSVEEVADEIIQVLQAQPTDQPAKQEGAD